MKDKLLGKGLIEMVENVQIDGKLGKALDKLEAATMEAASHLKHASDEIAGNVLALEKSIHEGLQSPVLRKKLGAIEAEVKALRRSSKREYAALKRSVERQKKALAKTTKRVAKIVVKAEVKKAKPARKGANGKDAGSGAAVKVAPKAPAKAVNAAASAKTAAPRKAPARKAPARKVATRKRSAASRTSTKSTPKPSS